MKSSRLRIVVSGLAATFPLGGVFWDYIQYVLGFARLGHDVLYLEDTGQWCYDPKDKTFIESGEQNAAYLAEELGKLDGSLRDAWTFRDGTGKTYGLPRDRALQFCREADLFLHISASCWMRDEYFEAKRVAFIDSDPLYTQSSVPGYLDGTASDDERSRIDMLKQHDVFLTFAENIDGEDCEVPRGIFDWKPTRQPIVVDCFEPHRVPVAARRDAFTTVASWKPREENPTVAGRTYGSKQQEFERFIDLPKHVAAPLELALSGKFPRDRLEAAGWRVRDAIEISQTPDDYRAYLANSLGEWSTAKNAYVASRSGWFSCRSACYLALGVPTVVQNTGFDRAIPSGEGLFAFDEPAQAVRAVEEVVSDATRHSDAAIDIAHEYFGHDRVLNRLLEDVL